MTRDRASGLTATVWLLCKEELADAADSPLCSVAARVPRRGKMRANTTRWSADRPSKTHHDAFQTALQPQHYVLAYPGFGRSWVDARIRLSTHNPYTSARNFGGRIILG